MTSSLLGKDKRGFFFLSVLQGGDISTETFVDIIRKQMNEIRMLDSSQSRKHHERYGKEDLAGVQETRTIGSGLRGHNDNQIRPLKPDDRPGSVWELGERLTLE